MISICMASHNGGVYITDLVNSILPQLGEYDELIISDDGSNDDTIDKISSFKDSRIRLFHYTQKKDYSHKHLSSYYYASANFSNAIKYAKGDYIFLADQDDVWLPNKVKTCVQALQQYDIISHNFSVIDKQGKKIEQQHLSSTQYIKLSILDFWRYLPFRGCCLAFNRKVFNLCTPIPSNVFEHDCWIGMNAIMHGCKYGYLAEPLIQYRRHQDNVSELVSPNNLMFKLTYRLKLLYLILRNY